MPFALVTGQPQLALGLTFSCDQSLNETLEDCTPPLTRSNSTKEAFVPSDTGPLVEGALKLRISELSIELVDYLQSKCEKLLLEDGDPQNFLPEYSQDKPVHGDSRSCLDYTPCQAMCDEPESYDNDEKEESADAIFDDRVSRRKALLIGIKYDKNEGLRGKSLNGPYHDVEEVQKLLQDIYGWDAECFRVLKDDGLLPQSQPTLDNIRHELRQLVEEAQTGDKLFFYFSGHGGQVPDLSGDEEDGMDEVLFTCDGKMIVDDELHEILVKPLPAGCRLTALLDCCSSGTGLDLPYNFVPQQHTAFQDRPFVRKHSNGDVVLLSACEDSQRAWENGVGGERWTMGMLTQAFVKSLRKRSKGSYNDLLSSVHTLLRTRHAAQDPQVSLLVAKMARHTNDSDVCFACPYTTDEQLSSSHEIDMNDHFDL
ncbi:hypothetical protein M0805_006754 [Coniferiporia weirii]|nr:hypothetical protein M0805_006754 [Coniferiporia weirii]